MSTDQKKGYFEEMWNKGKEALAIFTKGTKKKTLRLKFEGYANATEEKLIAKKQAIESFREKASTETDSLTGSDFQNLCQNLLDIEMLEKQKEFIRSEFFNAFGKEMKIDEE